MSPALVGALSVARRRAAEPPPPPPFPALACSHCLAAGVVANTGPFGAASGVPDLPITMLLAFDVPPSYEDLCNVLLTSVLSEPQFERFRSVAGPAPGAAPGAPDGLRWFPVPAAEVDLRHHVQVRDLSHRRRRMR